MTTGANIKCPHCNGRLKETRSPETYRCTRCGAELRQVVIDNFGSFKRVAEKETPAAKIAQAALEGMPCGDDDCLCGGN